jgi:hypothetical protein
MTGNRPDPAAAVDQANPEESLRENARSPRLPLSLARGGSKNGPVRRLSPSLFRFESRHPETGEMIEVEAEYFAPRRGSRDLYGAPLEPDDPEEILIRHVRTRSGAPVPFGKFERELEDEAFFFLPKFRNPFRRS